ncbi:MAG TPA: hypothetical protein VJ691_03715 [Vicinamibacterales bacterium]|nr:hypothetical protein [Vicinamibacterales bacterium]
MSNTRFASFALSCLVALALAPSCTRAEAIENIPAGTEVTVVTQDGTLVRGKIAKVEPELVTLTGERPNMTTEVARASITEVKRVEPGEPDVEDRSIIPVPGRRAPVVRTVTIPDNTVLDVTLDESHSSEDSRAEERVNGTLASAVEVDGVTAIPAGAKLTGHLTTVKDSGEVKGRAELGLQFTRLRTGSVTYDIDTKPLSWVAESTKKEDAVKIGAGAAAGAVIGAITGGKKGAAIGSAIGAGGGTAVVLATEGQDIRLAAGRKLKVSLTNPLTIRTK